MSFASVVLTKECIVVASDGQITDIKSLEVIDENYCKFANLTQYQAMVCTGNRDLMEHIYQVTKKKIKNYYISSDLKELSIFIKEILNQYEEEHEKCYIILCGFNKENLPELYKIHSSSPIIHSLVMVNKDCYIETMPSDHLQIEISELIDNFIKTIMHYGYDNPSDIEEYLREMNSIVSQNDISVNDTFHSSIILRKQSLLESIGKLFKI